MFSCSLFSAGSRYGRDRNQNTHAAHKRRFFGREAWLGYLLILPLLLVMVGLLAYPVVNALLISLQDKRLGTPGRFIGLDNYAELLFRDRRFWGVVRNSFVFTFGSVFGKLLIGIGMALVLNQRLKGRNFFRGWMLLPWVAPTFVTALTWRWMFDGTSGVINFILQGLGLLNLPIAWLGNGTTALLAVIVTNIWHGFRSLASRCWRPCRPCRSRSTRPPRSMAPRPGSGSGISRSLASRRC